MIYIDTGRKYLVLQYIIYTALGILKILLPIPFHLPFKMLRGRAL
jgi:hypothetical protein